MKKTLWFFALIMASSCSRHLPPVKKVPDSYSKIYKENKKEELKEYRQELKDWDVVLHPIETVPVTEYTFFEASQVKNWGEQLLLPEAIRQELVSRWKFPVLIKVFDTGARLTHPDLQEGQITGRNYTSSTGLDDIQGHSTHVSGIIAGKDFGMLYDVIKANKVRFQPIKILSDNGSGSFTWIANAFQSEEVDNDRQRSNNWRIVVNGSFGGGTSIIPQIEQHLANGYQKGTHFVFAAGNSGKDVNYPGMSQYAITASSLDENMKISSFSSRGPQVDHSAPGGKIRSTYKNGYADLSGTSMASPFLTSIVATAIGLYGDKLPTVGHTRAYLQKVATDLGDKGKDDLYGYGVNFVQHILNNPPDGTPNPEPTPDPEPNPTPNPNPTVTVQLIDKNNYLVKWGKPGLTSPAICRITEIEFTVTGNKNENELHDTGMAFVKEWVSKGSLIFNNSNATGYDAVFYSGFFLEKIAANQGIDLKIKSIIGMDQANRTFIVQEDFSKQTTIKADYQLKF